jgi:hypothetical protein
MHTEPPIPGQANARLCKVRGITLNYSASKLLNFDVIQVTILRADETEKVTVHTEQNEAKESRRTDGYNYGGRR